MQFSDLTIEGLARLEAKLLADVEVVRRMRALLEEHRAVWEGCGPGSAPVASGPVTAHGALGLPAVPATPAAPLVLSARAQRSLSEEAEDCLETFPGETFTTDDLRRALRKHGVNPRDSTMKTLMNRLLRSGKVVVHQLRKGRGGSLYRSTLPRPASPESPSLPGDALAVESAAGS